MLAKDFYVKMRFSRNLTLTPIKVQAPFQQWGMDFIGEVPNKSSGGYS